MNTAMNATLWGIQIILSIKMISVSYTHGLGQSQSTMQEAIQKMGKVSTPLHTIISICTFIVTIGLIWPGALRLSAWITPIMSVILSAMLLSSIFFHVKSRVKPKIFVSITLFAFAAFVAYGRWILVPL